MRNKQDVSPAESADSRRLNLLALAIGLCLLLVLLAIVEFVSGTILKRAGEKNAPFLVDFAAIAEALPSMQQTWGDTLVVSYIDPHLGYAHNPEANSIFGSVPGFVVYSSGDCKMQEALRIVALGGSTTDPLTPLFLEDEEVDPQDPYNWPKSLQEILDKEGYCVEVFNGGVAGYSSNQELLKLIRDVIPLEPNIVIWLDGINEMGFSHSVPKHPMVHDYQERLFKGLSLTRNSVLMPNTMKMLALRGTDARRTIEGVSFGTPIDTSPELQWLKNARLAKVTAKEFDFSFISFLQPIMGFGEYELSAMEQEMLDDRGESYLENLRKFYTEAKRLCEEYEFLVDATEAFKDTQNAYLDPRHQNELGVRVLAQTILEELLTRDMLRKN